MEELRELKALQLDALREVANIGGGHAATALSQMTQCRIMINVPRISLTRLEDLPSALGDPKGDVVAVLMHMLGDLTGRTLLMVPQSDARLLCDLLLRQEPGTTQIFDDVEQSAFKEAGNILAGAYLSALSDFMGMMLLPSVTSLMIDSAESVLTPENLKFGGGRDVVFCIETKFHLAEAGREVRGHFLVFPDLASLRAIFDAVRLT